MQFDRKFQSTRPVKDATARPTVLAAPIEVSIHASREGRDFNEAHEGLDQAGFQSTRPVKDATRVRCPRPHSRLSFNPRVP